MKQTKKFRVNEEKTPNYITNEEFNRLANIVNPDTGLKYDIPLLKSIDVDYLERYVDYMRLKEEDFEAFKKILEWD